MMSYNEWVHEHWIDECPMCTSTDVDGTEQGDPEIAMQIVVWCYTCDWYSGQPEIGSPPEYRARYKTGVEIWAIEEIYKKWWPEAI